MLERVLLYRGQKTYETIVKNIRRVLPVVKVDEGLWIASNADVILGDVEFISNVAKLISDMIVEFRPDLIVTPEAKSIAFAYQVARELGHSRIVVARKSVKSYMESYVVENVKSITTNSVQTLVLTAEDVNRVRDRKICILDDVVSTGSTLTALENLVDRAGGRTVCRASIWLEGPWYKRELLYLSELPIFVSEEKFKELNKQFK
ncbi:MAG: phosphoribosyltransferase [Aigarchaeota archaeon]|nr:phosphoribosyltransferase [Candidatus Geocrenenecus dongiae]